MVTAMTTPTTANPIAGHERCVDIAVSYRERMDSLDVAGTALTAILGDFLASERLRKHPDTWLITRAVSAIGNYQRAAAMPGWPEAVPA